MPRDKQLHLIETALQLFNRHGYHATGIDTIMAVSGVSKTTLYKYFRSKELLILAVLEYRHQNLSELFDSTIKASREAHPQAQESYHLHAFFDALQEWFEDDNFFGCNFINASAEFADKDHPVHRFACRHKHWLKDCLEELLDDAILAEQVMLLVDGAIVTAQVQNAPQAAETARQLACQLCKLPPR